MSKRRSQSGRAADETGISLPNRKAQAEWKAKPITDKELEQILEWWKGCTGGGAYQRRAPRTNGGPYFSDLAIKKFRELLAKEKNRS